MVVMASHPAVFESTKARITFYSCAGFFRMATEIPADSKVDLNFLGEELKMPMDFHDHESVVRRAEQRGFRPPHEGETEAEYRAAFAKWLLPRDSVESTEVSTGVPWDEMNEQQRIQLLTDKMGLPATIKLLTALDDSAVRCYLGRSIVPEENGDPPS